MANLEKQYHSIYNILVEINGEETQYIQRGVNEEHAIDRLFRTLEPLTNVSDIEVKSTEMIYSEEYPTEVSEQDWESLVNEKQLEIQMFMLTPLNKTTLYDVMVFVEGKGNTSFTRQLYRDAMKEIVVKTV